MQDSHERIVLDMQRARQEGFLFGSKLVRGAYLHLERGRAKEKGYPSPIHDSTEATHANYDRFAPTLPHAAALVLYFNASAPSVGAWMGRPLHSGNLSLHVNFSGASVRRSVKPIYNFIALFNCWVCLGFRALGNGK